MKTKIKYMYAFSIALIIVGSVLIGTNLYFNETENNFYESIEKTVSGAYFELQLENLTYIPFNGSNCISNNYTNDVFVIENWTYGFSEYNSKDLIEIRIHLEFQFGFIQDIEGITSNIYLRGNPYRYDYMIYNPSYSYLKVIFSEHYSYFTDLSKPFWI